MQIKLCFFFFFFADDEFQNPTFYYFFVNLGFQVPASFHLESIVGCFSWLIFFKAYSPI